MHKGCRPRPNSIGRGRAAAAVEAPVPPFATGKVPETAEPRATGPGVQSVPLKRRCWLAKGAVEVTFTPRIRATVLAVVVPVTSPASVLETFVTLRLVNP